MRVRKYIPPISILLFLALTSVGAYYARKAVNARVLREAIALEDGASIESALRRWPCAFDPKSDQAKNLIRWAQLHGEGQVYRTCREKGVAPVDQSWFPLGGEVYQEHDRDAAAEQVLAFRAETRWFKPWPKRVSKAEYDAWLADYEKRTHSLMELDIAGPDPLYPIPGQDRHPREATDLPLEDHGVTLSLKVSPTDNVALLHFEVTLSTRKGDVKREVEHRWTNVLPFLFAFCVNGVPYTKPLDEFGREGGANSFVEIVKAGESRTWSLRVERASLSKLLPLGAREVAVVAAFSDRQHEGWFGDDRHMDLSEMLSGEPPYQFLLRSNPATLPLPAPQRGH